MPNDYRELRHQYKRLEKAREKVIECKKAVEEAEYFLRSAYEEESRVCRAANAELERIRRGDVMWFLYGNDYAPKDLPQYPLVEKKLTPDQENALSIRRMQKIHANQ